MRQQVVEEVFQGFGYEVCFIAGLEPSRVPWLAELEAAAPAKEAKQMARRENCLAIDIRLAS
jgi:hypothetical protein